MEKEYSFAQMSHIISKCFAGRSRRKVKVYTRKSVNTNRNWDGGSRDTVIIFDFEANRAVSVSELPSELVSSKKDPFGNVIHDVTLNDRYGAVIHVIFCGKDLGYRLYVSEDRSKNLTKE